MKINHKTRPKTSTLIHQSVSLLLQFASTNLTALSFVVYKISHPHPKSCSQTKVIKILL